MLIVNEAFFVSDDLSKYMDFHLRAELRFAKANVLALLLPFFKIKKLDRITAL